VRDLSTEELTARLEAFTGRTGLQAAVEISREKMQTLADFWPLSGFFFDGPADDPKAREKWHDEDGLSALADVRDAIAELATFDVENLESALQKVVERRQAKPRDVYQPIRVAIAGTPVSPGIFESLAVLGKGESLRRLERVLQN
jgi:glutamyl-tRNA synthetase